MLGGGRAGASFAWAVAGRLARLPGARCAVLGSVLGEESRAPGRAFALGPAAPAARRVARGLVADGHVATVRGRVVEVAIDVTDGDTAGVLAAVGHHAPDAPVLTHLPGPRRPELDALLGRQDLLLVVVGDGAAPSLAALAVAELSAAAPGAVVRAVELPGRRGVAARRAAVRGALEELR